MSGGGRCVAASGRHVRVCPVIAGLLLLAFFALPAAAQARPFAYVVNQGSSNVSQYDVGAGGALSSLSPATVAAGTGPYGVAVSPNGASVYVANLRGNTVSQYDVGAGGALTPKSPATVAAGTGPYGVAVSPNGASVYVANNGSSSVSQYDVGAGGALTPKSPATVAAGTTPIGLAISPNGASVYVANNFSSSVSQYDVGAGGVLTPKSPATVAAGGNTYGVAVSPNGASVYVTNAGGNRVSQYDVGAGGALTPKSPATVAAGTIPSGVAVSPNGASVYVANLNDNTVSQYDVGAGGTLTPKSPATVAAGGGPYGVAISPNGASVYVTNGNGNTVSQYDVGAGGALTSKSPATVAAGGSPVGVAVSLGPESPTTGLAPSLGGYLVPVYALCNVGGANTYQANAQHSGPLAVPSCGAGGTTNGPRLATGGGSGNKPAVGPDTNKPVWPFSYRFTKPGVGAPCANGAVGSTICVTASLDSLVTFTTENPPYVTSAPFTGTIGLNARARVTDDDNCQPGPGCAGPYIESGTGTDFEYGPIPCASAVGGDGKSHCSVNSDINTALPGAVKNGVNTNFQLFRVRADILSSPYAGTPQRLLAQQGIAWP